jgi:hypothetical protein
MTPADLQKLASKGPYKGLSRGDIFRMKIGKKSPFTLSNGQKVVATKWDEVTKTLYVGTRKISLAQIKKDSDMGGGGSGAGSDLTAITECGQCFVSSIAYNVLKRKIEWEDLTLENLTKAGHYCSTDISLDEVIEKSTPEWVQSYIKTANITYTNYKMSGSPVYFHRGSDFMSGVYKAKKVVFDADKKSDNQQAPGTFSDDKWNPGDIWMTTLRSVPEISTADWASLNRDIYEWAKKRKMIGVSLKKVGNVAHFEEYNEPTRKETKSYRYEGFRVSSATERGPLPPFFNSIDLYMKVSGREIQFRATDGEKGWQGEIKAETAAGGKIGGGNVNFYLKKYTGKGIFDDSESEVVNFTKRKDFMKEFYDLYKKHFQGTILSFNDFEFYAKEKQKESKGYLFSKYMNMKFIDIFLSVSADKRNKIATDFFRYAASNTDQSSFFVKVS